MTRNDEAKRCAYSGCTCHVERGSTYCSEECRRAAANGRRTGCRCGHAACAASEYAAAVEPHRESA